jgi:hypothetical protein
VQVITALHGTIVWTSAALPGSINDVKAARILGLLWALEKSGLFTLADKGYIDAGQHVITLNGGWNKPESQKIANRSRTRLRAPGKRGNAQQKPGGSCGNYAAAPTAPATSPKPSTSFKPTRPLDEKGSGSVRRRAIIDFSVRLLLAALP